MNVSREASLSAFRKEQEQAAAILGVSLKTLYNRLKDYAAEDSAKDEESDGNPSA